jgi:hypothetical protein
MRRGNLEVIGILKPGSQRFILGDKTRLLRYARNDSEGAARKGAKLAKKGRSFWF